MEYICKVSKNLADPVLLKIIRDYDHRGRTLELNRSKNYLEDLINEGTEDPMILKLWKTSLKAKKKQLVEHQGVVPGTPESSDDEDEENDEHDSTFSAVQPVRNLWMVPPNERTNKNYYQNEPVQQQMVPHELTKNANPHEKFWSSQGWCVTTQQENINIPQIWKKDERIPVLQKVSLRTVKLKARTNTEHTRRIKHNYMENESFL